MQPQPGMMMFPYPMGMPQSQPRTGDQLADRIPVRIAVAMRFLDVVYQYQEMKPFGVASDSLVEIEHVPGVQPSQDIQGSRASACQLLSSFFSGEFVPQSWELPQNESLSDRGKGSMLNCFACGRQGLIAGRKCNICEGTGFVIVYPANPEGDSGG